MRLCLCRLLLLLLGLLLGVVRVRGMDALTMAIVLGRMGVHIVVLRGCALWAAQLRVLHGHRARETGTDARRV